MSRDHDLAHGERRHDQLRRMLVVWILAGATLGLLSVLLSAVHVDSFGAAMLAVALISLINALVWPLLLRFALPITVLTLGFAVVLLNAAIVLLVSQIDLGLQVESFAAAVIITIALSIVSALATSVLAIDDDMVWYRNAVTRYGERTAPASGLDSDGLLLLEIDGLAHAVLMRAIRDGNAPTMSRWLREGSHQLTCWETDWSSQTGACQAGILHGDNDDK